MVGGQVEWSFSKDNGLMGAMPFNRLSTAKVAKAAGCHPNTVRLYEQIGFIAPVPRSPKGYRLYTEAHLDQMRLARKGMEGGWPGYNIRRSITALIHLAAGQDYARAFEHACQHLEVVRAEQAQAEAAAEFLHHWVQGSSQTGVGPGLQIREVAQLLDISVDRLRNWERSGLVSVPRNPNNRYRQYHAPQIGRLRVIRLLRQVGYSPMAILRMLLQLDQGAISDLNSAEELRHALDTPRPDEDVYSAADHWLSTLAEQEQRAHELIALTAEMLKKYA